MLKNFKPVGLLLLAGTLVSPDMRLRIRLQQGRELVFPSKTEKLREQLRMNSVPLPEHL